MVGVVGLREEMGVERCCACLLTFELDQVCRTDDRRDATGCRLSPKAGNEAYPGVWYFHRQIGNKQIWPERHGDVLGIEAIQTTQDGVSPSFQKVAEELIQHRVVFRHKDGSVLR